MLNTESSSPQRIDGVAVVGDGTQWRVVYVLQLWSPMMVPASCQDDTTTS